MECGWRVKAGARQRPHSLVPTHRLREAAAGKVLGALDEQDDLVLGDEGVYGFFQLGRKGRVCGGLRECVGGCFFWGGGAGRRLGGRRRRRRARTHTHTPLPSLPPLSTHLTATGWRSPPGPGGAGGARAHRRQRRLRCQTGRGAGRAPRCRASAGGPGGGQRRTWWPASTWLARVSSL